MNSTTSRAQLAIDAAISHIKATMAGAASRVTNHLSVLAAGATRVSERDALIRAEFDLRHKMSTYVLVLGDTLSKRVSEEVSPHSATARKLSETDWSSLSLVDDAEVEEQMFAGRISQAMTHGCEWELREMASYTGALLGIGQADHDRNPLRPEVLGAAVYRAISAITDAADVRKLLAREMGAMLARVMAACYADIIKDFRARGIVPVRLSVRGVEGPGNELTKDRVHSGYDTLPRDPGAYSTGNAQLSSPSNLHADTRSLQQGAAEVRRGAAGDAGGGWGSSNAPDTGRRGGSESRQGSRPMASAQADAGLMTLIRRLTLLASRPAGLGDPEGAAGRVVDRLRQSAGGDAQAPSNARASIMRDAAGPVAVNLIRAHRDELRQASSGRLDHMVIDVVGSLFDQILSDPRVPPQMARQIARLQLPVLRVALGDNDFFSSRKHPVRRFVNRIASLACAFEDFDQGAGRHFLQRVSSLVQEIVEGDFDQVDLYTAKLAALERFTAEQARDDIQTTSQAASVVDRKEADLRVQLRYMLQLQAALAPLSLQKYLRDFLSQVWSQALVLGTQQGGPQSELAQRLRRVGRDLVMSVQPKGSTAMRKKFLMQLPALMKDLNEGLRLIGWSDTAQKSFFSQLLPAHAESLKGQPLSELEYNLLSKQLEAVFNTPVPEPDALLRDVPMTSSGALPIEPRFSPEEAQRIGLVEDDAVDWAGNIDIDLSATADAGADAAEPLEPPMGRDAEALSKALDIDLAPTEAPEPSQGPRLIDHLRLGSAYQMNLNSTWQKVRLSYVSPGRAFFVFTRGQRHAETLSLTARMMARMCEGGRFKAFESAHLLERATVRARRQLAALSAKGRPAGSD